MSDQTQRISNLITYSYDLLTTAQIHSTKSELRFCIGSNPARSMSKIRDGEDTTKKFTKTIQNWIFARQRTRDKNYCIVIIFHIDCSQKNQVTKI